MSILILCFVLAIVLGIQFYGVRKAALERFASYQSKAETITISYGRMSYIDEGSGEVIISCHGICGGYDQAYDTLADKTEQYRILAPSRFGYPGTDMPKEASIADQATAYVELLDTLHIEKAYILATSAGGSSAIKFALMYPERTKGLILYCSGYPNIEDPGDTISYAGPPGVICHDFPMWLFSPLFKPLMEMDQDTIQMIMPFADKNKGIVFDSKLTNTDMYNNYQDYDMSTLKVPVLMLHAKDDKLAAFDLVEKWSEKIPDCRAHFFESGGHLMTGNGEEIGAALDSFIQDTK